jgi:hypothetical protein
MRLAAAALALALASPAMAGTDTANSAVYAVLERAAEQLASQASADAIATAKLAEQNKDFDLLKQASEQALLAETAAERASDLSIKANGKAVATPGPTLANDLAAKAYAATAHAADVIYGRQ